MNECTNSEMRDLLPDLAHGTLRVAVRQTVEAHLAGCDSCREDLQIIHTVMSAAVFAPSIDAERVVRRIVPYRTPVTVRDVPARSRVTQWLVAATVGLLLIGGGTIFNNWQSARSPGVAAVTPPNQTTSAESVPPAPGAPAPEAPAPEAPAGALGESPHTRALSLAADIGELSDGSLQQLMDDMANFDALPNSEPEPVFAIDTSEGR